MNSQTHLNMQQCYPQPLNYNGQDHRSILNQPEAQMHERENNLYHNNAIGLNENYYPF